MNGTALENAPFEAIFRDSESGHRFMRHLPVQVQSCWNGIAVLDPAPMYAHPHVRFRMARLGEGECSASECSLICNDYWEAGYGRIMMVPRVKLAYDKVRFLSSYLVQQPLTLRLSFIASLGCRASRSKEFDCHPSLHTIRRPSRRPELRSTGSKLVWPTRQAV